jgi:catechol 2,3-dioxygenase-like lactoylglutathione lyase family enzyme
MAVTGLDHVNISTTDVEATREFFADVLEMEVGWRPPLNFPGYWMYRGGKDLVHIAHVEREIRPSRGSALDHFAFRIDDYDAAKARLDARGIEYRTLQSPDGGIRQFFFNELNGATIELNWRREG